MTIFTCHGCDLHCPPHGLPLQVVEGVSEGKGRHVVVVESVLDITQHEIKDVWIHITNISHNWNGENGTEYGRRRMEQGIEWFLSAILIGSAQRVPWPSPISLAQCHRSRHTSTTYWA